MNKFKGLDFFKKIRDTKGTFHSKMGTKMDRNGMDLTKAEEEVARIHKKLNKKDLHDPDKHDGVIIHLEPGILKSSGPQEESLGTKLAEVMEFQLSYFQS